MSATETVRVTNGHIERGSPQQPDACPIALAIRAQHPEASVDVYNDFALMFTSDNAPMLSARLPELAQKFVRDFDFEDGPVGPIEFDLTWESEEEVTAR